MDFSLLNINQIDKYPPKCQIKRINKEGKEEACGSNCKYNQKEARYTDRCWRHYRSLKKEMNELFPPILGNTTKKSYQILLKKMVEILSKSQNQNITKNQVIQFVNLQDLNGKTKTQFMKDYISEYK
jgi:hypothetical protein